MERKEYTLNPSQITQAIERGNVKNVSKAYGYSVIDDEDKHDYDFEIDGEVYHCRQGKVFVQYDFALSPQLLTKLHLTALQESLARERSCVSRIEEKLAEVTKQYEDQNRKE